MSLSIPTVSKPRSAKYRTASEPTSPADPVMIATAMMAPSWTCHWPLKRTHARRPPVSREALPTGRIGNDLGRRDAIPARRVYLPRTIVSFVDLLVRFHHAGKAKPFFHLAA